MKGGYEIELKPLEVKVIAGTKSVGIWREVGSFLNCYKNFDWKAPGSTYKSDTPASCMLECISNDKCTSIVIQWLEEDNRSIQCFLRSKITNKVRNEINNKIIYWF